jgi:hypothetical protein
MSRTVPAKEQETATSVHARAAARSSMKTHLQPFKVASQLLNFCRSFSTPALAIGQLNFIR